MSVQKSSFGPWRKNEKQELVYFVSKWAARGLDKSKSGKVKEQKSKSKPKTSELDKDIRVGREQRCATESCKLHLVELGCGVYHVLLEMGITFSSESKRWHTTIHLSFSPSCEHVTTAGQS